MTTTNHTPTDLRLSASAWAEVCGLTGTEMLDLLASMPPGIVEQDEAGRWSLTTDFVDRYGQALREFVGDDDETDDKSADPQGAVLSPFGARATLPRPAPSRRAGQLFSSAGGGS